MRVVIIKDYVKSNFPATPLLDYAIEVEKITTSKVLVHVLDRKTMGVQHLMKFRKNQWVGSLFNF